MSNVKPGDLARVTVDPDNMGIKGLQVHVRGDVPIESFEDLINLLAAPGHVWDCEVLETRRYRCSDCGKSHLMRAGETFAIPDAWLKRIEPPADSLELLRTEPLPGEHRSMEDLQQYIKEHS